MVGPVLDASGVAVTDCVVADFEGSVNGGDPAALNGSATLTHRGVGFYSLSLTATDLGTVGSFQVTINDTVNCCPMMNLTIVEEAVYDSLFAASATGYQIPIWSSAGATVNLSATTVKTLTDAVTLPASATIAITGNITGNLSGSVGSVAGAVGSVTGNVGGNVTGSVGSVIGAVGSVTGAVGSVTGAVGSVTGNVGGNVVGSVASVTAAVTLPTIPTDWITANGIAANAIGASELATDAVAEIADAVWDEDATAHSTLASTGKYLTFGSDSANNAATQIGTAGAGLTAIGDTRIANLDATVSSRSTLTQTQVSGGAYALNSASFAFNAAVNNAIADQVWDEVLSGHLTAGTTGNALNAAGSAGDPWSTSLPGAYGAGSAGYIIGTNLNATVSSRSSHDAAAVVTALGTGSTLTAIPWNAAWDTEVQSECSDALVAYDPPTNAEMEARTIVSANYGTAANQTTIIGYIDTEVAAILAAVDTEVAAIKAKTDQLTFTVANQVDSNALTVVGTADDAVLAAIAALNNLSAAQVNTEVDTALSDVGVTLARMGALTDWIDGGRLDLILDARASQTSVDDVPTNAELTSALASADDATLAAIAALNNISTANVTTSVTTALTTALTEGYRGTGATGSVRDLLYEVIAHMGESSIVTTTKTLKKLDGSTTAKVYTLNDGTTPTAITETT